MLITQELNVEDLIEDIEFAYCVGLPRGLNPEKAITLENVYDILKKHFPQIQTYIDGTNTTNDTPKLA